MSTLSRVVRISPDGTPRARGAAPSAGSTRTGPRRALAYPLLALLALVPLVPALFLPYLPTVDGPAHVLDAYVIAHYDDPDQPALRQEYVLTAAPTPNLLTQVSLAALLKVLSPSIAEKVFAVAVVVLFGLGATYAVRAVDRRNTLLAAVAAPMATGYFFYFGFYNFCLGTALFLFCTGYFLKHRPRWTPLRTVALLGLLLLTVSAHLLPFGMAALVITLTVLLDALRALRLDRAGTTGTARRLPPVLREAVPVAAALVVPSALALLFLLRSDNVQGAGLDPDAVETGSSSLSLRQLLRATIGQVTVYNRQEVALGLLLFAGLGLLVVLAARRQLSVRGRAVPALLLPLTAMVLLCTALYLVFPTTVGTLSLIRPRFGLFAILFSLLALATLRHDRRVLTGLLAVVAVVAVGLPVARSAPQREVMQELREYQTVAGVLRPNSSFVTFRTAQTASLTSGGTSYDFAVHQASRVAMASRTVQLNHLDGRYDYFPAHFRDLEGLGARMTDLDSPEQWRQLLEETRGASGPDYVLVWDRRGMTEQVRTEPDYREAQELLDAEYRRVWRSEPQGLMEVYEHR